mgnify:FL=1
MPERMCWSVYERMGLLERCTEEVGCTCLSDLRYLDTKARFRLAGAVEQIPPGDYSLAEWNDALDYLAGGAPAPSTGEAKQRLLLGLTRLRFQK